MFPFTHFKKFFHLILVFMSRVMARIFFWNRCGSSSTFLKLCGKVLFFVFFYYCSAIKQQLEPKWFSSVVAVPVRAHELPFTSSTLHTAKAKYFHLVPPRSVPDNSPFGAAGSGSQKLSFNNLLLKLPVEFRCWEACMLSYSFMTTSCEKSGFVVVPLPDGGLTYVNAWIWSSDIILHHHHFWNQHVRKQYAAPWTSQWNSLKPANWSETNTSLGKVLLCATHSAKPHTKVALFCFQNTKTK